MVRAPSLCQSCGFVRLVDGRHGQVFYLCRNEAIPEKYPHQPVLTCPGYTPKSISGDEALTS